MNIDVHVSKDLKALIATIQQMNVKESSVKMGANVLMDTMNTFASANMDSQVFKHYHIIVFSLNLTNSMIFYQVHIVRPI